MSHRARPSVSRHRPVHVVVRLRPRLRNLRARGIYKMVRQAFCHARKRFFRIVHYSVQGNHIHLLVEAHNKRALARGMQGFQIRVARGLNRIMGGRRGAVFADRYHATQIASPRQARHALVYVLNNARRHADRLHHREAMTRTFVDPCSSAAYFDGWKSRRHVPQPEGEPPVAEARSWLLTTGWREHHPLISTGETPGALRS